MKDISVDFIAVGGFFDICCSFNKEGSWSWRHSQIEIKNTALIFLNVEFAGIYALFGIY